VFSFVVIAPVVATVMIIFSIRQPPRLVLDPTRRRGIRKRHNDPGGRHTKDPARGSLLSPKQARVHALLYTIPVPDARQEPAQKATRRPLLLCGMIFHYAAVCESC
jgi:hypothetical protein